MKVNLLDPGAYEHGQPFEQMTWLQEHDPVHWHAEPNDGPGFWAVTRYADVKAVHSNPKLFSSRPTITVMDSFAPGDGNHPYLMCGDPPHHTAYRRFLGQELAPAAVRARTDHVEEIAHAVIDDVIERGECDLVRDIAGNLACYIAADLLGLPRREGVEMYEIADRAANAENTEEGDGLAAATELYKYAASIRSGRLACPRDDAVTRYAHGVVDGIQSDEMQFFLDFFVLFGGAVDGQQGQAETTRRGSSGHRCGGDRGFAEQVLVPERALVRIDPAVLFDVAAVLGCAVVTGIGAATNSAHIRSGDTVAVIGCGGVGLNVIQGARLRGAGRIVAIDLSSGRLARAAEFGATDIVNASDGRTLEQIADLIPAGVDHAFEVAGASATLQQAVRMLGPGGVAYIIGAAVEPVPLSWITAQELLIGAKSIVGIYAGSARFKHDIPRYADMDRRGVIQLDALISDRIGLDQVTASYRRHDNSDSARAVIVF